LYTPTEEINEFFIQLGKNGFRPILSKIEQEVFHGTSEEIAGIIVGTQHLIESPEERGMLGRGVYFYENKPIAGPEIASAWAKHDKKYSTQAVVVGHISAEAIFDLTLKENKNYFQLVFDWAANKAKLASPEDVWKLTVPKVIKFILSNCPERDAIQVARWNGFKLPALGTTCQFGLVVRDQRCIKRVWLHS